MRRASVLLGSVLVAALTTGAASSTGSDDAAGPIAPALSSLDLSESSPEGSTWETDPDWFGDEPFQYDGPAAPPSEDEPANVGTMNRAYTEYELASITAPASGACGLTVARPHYSKKFREIHTQVISECKTFVLVKNCTAAYTYRSRWYGWQRVGTMPWRCKSGWPKQRYFRVATAWCDKGSWHKYRTAASGYVITANGQTMSGSTYHSNGDEIGCPKP